MSDARLYQVTAIVLRSREYGEGNRMITLFSREHGKITATAKGVKKPLAKLAGALQHFSLLEVHLAVGRKMDVITQARVLNSFYGMRTNVDAFAYASYFAELLEAATEERQQHEELYDLLVTALEQLAAGAVADLIARYVEIHLAVQLGYLPYLSECAHCEAPLAAVGTDGEAVWPTWVGFSSTAGGALCPDCREIVPGARRVSSSSLRIIRILLAHGLPALEKLQMSDGLRREMAATLQDYLEYRLELRPQSRRFLGLGGEEQPAGY